MIINSAELMLTAGLLWCVHGAVSSAESNVNKYTLRCSVLYCTVLSVCTLWKLTYNCRTS